MLVDEAVADKTDLRLYRIGVALHTYADTWSHQRFSGRKHNENNVEVLCKWENQDWKKCKRLFDIVLDLFRAKVGHLQAFNYPDYSYVHWQYKINRKDQPYQRKNYEEFLKTFKDIELSSLISKKYHPFLKEDYFKVINTKEKAYWLGFIYADGAIIKTINKARNNKYSYRIKLCQNRRDKK